MLMFRLKMDVFAHNTPNGPTHMHNTAADTVYYLNFNYRLSMWAVRDISNFKNHSCKNMPWDVWNIYTQCVLIH